LYKRALDDAQAEILRAQSIVDGLERALNDAEERAARARDMARKWREVGLVERAREEGRREGMKEGMARGRSVGWYEGRAEVVVEEDDDEEESIEQEPLLPRQLPTPRPPSSNGHGHTSPSIIMVRPPSGVRWVLLSCLVLR
jgi:flagellar biosynthesis/type III secretory pathway protein FliH